MAIDVAIDRDRVKFLNTLSDVMWTIDGIHFTRVLKGCDVPDLFIKFNANNKLEMHIHKRKYQFLTNGYNILPLF